MPDSRFVHTRSARSIPSVDDVRKPASMAARHLPDFVDSEEFDDRADLDEPTEVAEQLDLDEPWDGDELPDFEEETYTERLAYDEVAAVRINRRFYVNDVPSPYLTKRQAREDIETTRRRHTVISTVLVLLLIAAMIGGAGWYVWDTLRPEEKPDVPKYNTATIERIEFVDSIDATTIVRPIDERSVISEVSGTVTEVLAAEGAFVNEGDVLYTLDNPTVSETLSKAQEALDVAQGSVDNKASALQEAQAELDQIRSRSSSSSSSTSSTSSSNNGTRTDSSTGTSTGTGNRTTTTSNDSAITTNIARMTTTAVFHLATERSDGYTTNDDSEDDSTDSDSTGTTRTNGTNSSDSSTSSSSRPKSTAETKAEAAVRKAQAELDEAKADLEPIQEMFDRAQDQFDHLTVRSPIAGTVSDLNASIKLEASVIGSERLCTVSDLSAYLVQQEVPAERMGQVYEGEEVRLSFPAINDLYLTSFVSDVQDNDDGTARIASTIIENPDERITKNMACNVSIVVQSIPNALVVPIEALNTNAEGSTELNMLLDPSRGINTYVHVNVLGTNATQAAVEADNIQAGTSVILPTPAEEADVQEDAPAEEAPAEEAPAEETQAE